MGSHLGASWKSDVASLISSTLAAGSGITVTTSAGTVTIAANASAAYTRTSFTATAGQTTFSSTYTVGTLQVYVNGVLLNAADYTASNGTSVVLATACAVNDIVELVAFNAVGSSVMAPANGGTGVNNGSNTLTMGGAVAFSGAFTQTFVATGNSNVTLPTSGTLLSSTALTPYSAAPLFGTGADGNVTISSGTTTLTRDMHYSSLTISGTGQIATNGFRIFVSGTLNLANAPANAIISYGSAGGAASGATAGAAGGTTQGGQATTVPRAINPVAGATGTTAAGSSGGAGSGSGVSLVGGGTGGGGAGGAGTNAGGAAQAPAAATNPAAYFATPTLFFATNNPGLVIPLSAQTGNGGSSGGGDGTNTGGGGGGGGGAAQAIVIYARYIARGTNTNTGVINASGSAGGIGGSSSAGNTGGGGGGSAGGGGFVYIVTESVSGSVIANAITVSGAAGGAGGAGFGTGKGGAGGYGSNAGCVQVLVLSQTGATTGIATGGTVSASGFNATVFNAAGTAGGTTATTAGGTAGTGGTMQVGL